jgi:hypothetical protein
MTAFDAELGLANPADFPDVGNSHSEGKVKVVRLLRLGEAFLLLLRPKSQALEALHW